MEIVTRSLRAGARTAHPRSSACRNSAGCVPYVHSADASEVWAPRGEPSPAPGRSLWTVAPLLALLAGCQAAQSEEGAHQEGEAAPPQAFDVETIELGEGTVEVRFHVLGGDDWHDPIVLRVSERPVAAWLSGGALSVVETRGDRVRVRPAAPSAGKTHTIEFEFDSGLVQVGPDDPSDRVALVTRGGTGSRTAVSRTRVVPASADLSPPQAEPPAAASVAFTHWCEQTLLSLFPSDAAEAPGRRAAYWFGDLVAASDSSDGAAIAALPSVLAHIWAEEEASARGGAGAALAALVDAGAHAARVDDAWAVPRHMEVRRVAGAERYREALRALVLEHAGSAPIGVEELAVALEAVESPEAAAYARAWLQSPARPRVHTQWRFDGERGRVLVRVDQVHSIDEGSPPAYPFTLPVRLITTSGSLVDFDLEIDARRELLEVPATLEPLALNVDPDGTLAGQVDFEATDER